MEAVCKGMSSAMEFMKKSGGSGIKENLLCIRHSLPCLEFIIGDLAYIKNVVDYLSDKLPQVSETYENVELAESKLKTSKGFIITSLSIFQQLFYRC